MRVIYICPVCGADLDDIVLTVYPPKYLKMCKNMKCGWHYIESPEEDAVVRIPYEPEYTNPCRGCANAGKGACNCALPSMAQRYTTASDTDYMFGGMQENV